LGDPVAAGEPLSKSTSLPCAGRSWNRSPATVEAGFSGYVLRHGGRPPGRRRFRPFSLARHAPSGTG